MEKEVWYAARSLKKGDKALRWMSKTPKRLEVRMEESYSDWLDMQTSGRSHASREEWISGFEKVKLTIEGLEAPDGKDLGAAI